MAATTPRNVRLDDVTHQRLAEISGDRGQAQAALMADCIREGLAMRRHPGVTFHDGPTGRRAAIEGGADVWEVAARAEVLREDHDPDQTMAALVAEFALPSQLLDVALRYWAENVEEIHERISRDQLERRRSAERREARRALLSPTS